MLSYYVSLRSEFHVEVAIAVSGSVSIYLQFFVGQLMSYLRYLCLFSYSGAQHILCCVFVLFVLSCLSIVASSS